MIKKSESAAERLQKQRAYEKAAEELEKKEKNKGLWAKALADGDFDERSASKLYLEYRVQSILDEEQLAREIEPVSESAPKNQRQSEEGFVVPLLILIFLIIVLVGVYA